MTDTPEVEPPKPAEESERPLIFDWHRPSRRTTWVAFSAVIALGLMFSVSVFFRVQRSEWRNTLPNTYQVVLLDPSVPAASGILNRAENMSTLALGRRSDDESAPALASQMPVFQPGFKSYDYRLKELPEARPEPVPPSWMTAYNPPLPTRPEIAHLPERKVMPQIPKYELKVIPGPSLKTRLVRTPLKLPKTDQIDFSSLVFRTAVASNGRVMMSLPLHNQSSQADAVEALRKLVAGLKFAPLANAGIVWEDLRFAWEVPSNKR